MSISPLTEAVERPAPLVVAPAATESSVDPFDARTKRRDDKAAQAVARVFVPQDTLDRSHDSAGGIELLRSRISTFIVIMDLVEQFDKSRNRTQALSLVIVTDFCWQFVRTLGGIIGDDRVVLGKALPADHARSDEDVGDEFFARQIEIVEDAKWIFDLHTFIRHPRSIAEKNLWLLKEPVANEHASRLVRGASDIRQVLLKIAARL